METTIEIEVREGYNIVLYEDDRYFVFGSVEVEIEHTEIYPATHENPAEYKSEENVTELDLEVWDKLAEKYVSSVNIKWVVV